MAKLRDTERGRRGDTEIASESAGSNSPRLPISASPSHPHSSSALPEPHAQPEPLSIAEKRSLIAQLVRANLLDCFDDSGAFDLDRARRTLPAWAVQEIIIDETERTDRQGNTTVRRKIRLRLVDKLRALKHDDLLERAADEEKRKQEKAEAPRPIHIPDPPRPTLSEEEIRRRDEEVLRRYAAVAGQLNTPPKLASASDSGTAGHPGTAGFQPAQTELPQKALPSPPNTSQTVAIAQPQSAAERFERSEKDRQSDPQGEGDPSSTETDSRRLPEGRGREAESIRNPKSAILVPPDPRNVSFSPYLAPSSTKPRVPSRHRTNTVEHIDLTPISPHGKYPCLTSPIRLPP